MASLAAKYDYLEKLTRKVCVSHNQEPKKKLYVPFRASAVNDGAPPKKKKQKPTKGVNNMSMNKTKPVPKIAQPAASPTLRQTLQNGISETQKKPNGGKSQEFDAVDILRQRLHQKIEESRGQGPPKDPSSNETKKKRERRKQERERRKRKRKEFRLKKLADAAALEAGEEDKETAKNHQTQVTSTSSAPAKKEQSFIVFNKMEVGEDYVDKGTKLIEKKKKRKVKGTLTPLTGKNYKQLLTRIEARKAHLEQLREKDEAKAKKEEEKMRWTNVLYKAEGMKIKDNEELLCASLKKKEKRKDQKKKKWAQRSQHVVEKMQKRQDKRRRNIKKRKDAKMEKRKQRARKKGCVLPEDLKKASL